MKRGRERERSPLGSSGPTAARRVDDDDMRGGGDGRQLCPPSICSAAKKPVPGIDKGLNKVTV